MNTRIRVLLEDRLYLATVGGGAAVLLGLAVHFGQVLALVAAGIVVGVPVLVRIWLSERAARTYARRRRPVDQLLYETGDQPVQVASVTTTTTLIRT